MPKKSKKILEQRIEDAREDERRRLARLLHDDIGQQIAAVLLKIESLKSKLVELLPGENLLLLELLKIEKLLRKNQQALRNLARILHPSILEQCGLAEGLKRFLENLSSISNKSLPAISIEISQDFPHFEPPIETGIYRIVQESVTNAIKHSGSKSISLKLKTYNNLAIVTVKDDGKGFDYKKNRNNGIGIAIMRERANDIGAKLNVKSDRETGTTVTLSLPA